MKLWDMVSRMNLENADTHHLVDLAIIKGNINPDMRAILQSLLIYNITRKDEYIDEMICSLAAHSMEDNEEEE